MTFTKVERPGEEHIFLKARQGVSNHIEEGALGGYAGGGLLSRRLEALNFRAGPYSASFESIGRPLPMSVPSCTSPPAVCVEADAGFRHGTRDKFERFEPILSPLSHRKQQQQLNTRLEKEAASRNEGGGTAVELDAWHELGGQHEGEASLPVQDE